MRSKKSKEQKQEERKARKKFRGLVFLKDTKHGSKLMSQRSIKESMKGLLAFFSDESTEINGKPLPFSETLEKITLAKKIKIKKQNGKIEYKIILFGDSYNNRQKGEIVEEVKEEFRIYYMTYDNRKYIVFSKDKIDGELVKLRGMVIEVSDSSEISRTLKIPSHTNFFISSKCEPYIKKLDKKNLVELTQFMKKEYDWTYTNFPKFLFSLEGKEYTHPKEFEKLIVAQTLSGRINGMPLNLFIIGPAGSGKTTTLESLNEKFIEIYGIYDASSSTLKGLIISFKDKIPKPGYMLSVIRMGLVDELLKMLQGANIQTKYAQLNEEYLGQLNTFLEGKSRTYGSGNANLTFGKVTGKFIFSCNPLKGANSLEAHFNKLDLSMLSRCLVYVQNKEHQKIVYEKKDFTLDEAIGKKYILKNSIIEYNGKEINPFLTIFDSVNDFLSKFDLGKVKEIFNESLEYCYGRVNDLWKARGLILSSLVLDGLVKYRCLFKDFTDDFEAKEEDYKELKELIFHLVESWKTDLSYGGRL